MRRTFRRCCIMGVVSLVLLILYKIFVTNAYSEHSNGVPSADNISSQRYTVVVDAGSSGSRIYIYCLPSVSNDPSELPPITLCSGSDGKSLTKKVTPGLSSFSKKISLLDSYISDLIGLAYDHIPKQLHSSTPVYILGTAGMRLCTEHEQEQIWQRVRAVMKNKFSFQFENSWAQTVTGLHEALFGWVTVNYLLGKFSASPAQLEKTVGMLDMGGASMQIAYEVPLTTDIPSELYMDFKVGSENLTSQRTYRVYVMTFLNYGTHATKIRYKVALLHNAMEYSKYSRRLKARFRPSTGYVKSPKLSTSDVDIVFMLDGTEKFILSDPCMQPGLEDTLTLEDLANSQTIYSQEGPPVVFFHGSGNFTECQSLQQRLLKKTPACKREPCSMNGVHQPVVDFEQTTFYAMSEYWYTSSDLMDKVNIYSSSEFQNFAENNCKTPWITALETYQAKDINQFALMNKQGVCFKASWIINVLHNGFRFPVDYNKLHLVDQIGGIELQWSLGAFIYYMQQTPLSASDGKSYSFISRTLKVTILVLLVILFVCLIMAAAICSRWRQTHHRWFTRVKAVFVSSPVSSSVPPTGSKGGGMGDSKSYSYSKISSPPPTYYPMRPQFEDGLPSNTSTTTTFNGGVNLRSSAPFEDNSLFNV